MVANFKRKTTVSRDRGLDLVDHLEIAGARAQHALRRERDLVESDVGSSWAPGISTTKRRSTRSTPTSATSTGSTSLNNAALLHCADPQRRGLRPGDHDRRGRRLGHRLQRGDRRLDLWSPRRRVGAAAEWIDPLPNRLATTIAGLRRHRLRRIGAENGGGEIDVTADVRSAGAAADRPADGAAAPTARSTPRSPTGPRSSPPPTTRPTGRRGGTSCTVGATTPAGASASPVPGRDGWASRCFIVAIVWLWDERLFDHDPQRVHAGALSRRRASSAGSTGSCCGTPIRSSGSTSATSSTTTGTCPASTTLSASFTDAGCACSSTTTRGTSARAANRPATRPFSHRSSPTSVSTACSSTRCARAATSSSTALRRLDPPPVLEGESRVPLERIADHQMSWAQWFADTTAPGVLAAHWFERSHLLHHTRRWNRDHSDELQSSWMNGTGMIVWDAVFGSWVGWNDRDRSTLRRMARCQLALAEVLRHGEWTPLVDAATAGRRRPASTRRGSSTTTSRCGRS